ncbi:hypothetical protein ACWGM4_08195 [Streptomyces albidoflavus]
MDVVADLPADAQAAEPASARAQAAITEWAREHEKNRYKVEKAVREAVRHPESEGE